MPQAEIRCSQCKSSKSRTSSSTWKSAYIISAEVYVTTFRHAPKSRLGRNGHTAQVHQLFMGKFEQESWVMIRSGTHPPNQESRRKRPGIYSDK